MQRHPIGVEGLEVLRALANAGKLYWLPGHAADENGGTALGVTVKLGQDTAAEATMAVAVTLVSYAAAMLTATQSVADSRPDGGGGSVAIAMQ